MYVYVCLFLLHLQMITLRAVMWQGSIFVFVFVFVFQIDDYLESSDVFLFLFVFVFFISR